MFEYSDCCMTRVAKSIWSTSSLTTVSPLKGDLCSNFPRRYIYFFNKIPWILIPWDDIRCRVCLKYLEYKDGFCWKVGPAFVSFQRAHIFRFIEYAYHSTTFVIELFLSTSNLTAVFPVNWGPGSKHYGGYIFFSKMQRIFIPLDDICCRMGRKWLESNDDISCKVGAGFKSSRKTWFFLIWFLTSQVVRRK